MTRSYEAKNSRFARCNSRVATRPWGIALALFLCVAFASAFAGDFDLTWHTIDGGGGTSAGGGFELSGTIGQHDAGAMAGGEFSLVGGFWTTGGPTTPPPTCIGDITNSGTVGVPDLLALLSAWGPCPAPCAADLTGSGNVGVPDLLALLGAWGSCE